MSNSKPVVDWYGPVFSAAGYGRHARELALRLHDMDVDISLQHRGVRHDIDFPEKQERKLNNMVRKNPRNRYENQPERNAIEVWVLNPAHALCNMSHSIWDPDVYSINLTVYEAEQIPKPWVSMAESFDEIWVPAKFAQQSFENSGVSNQFRVMPEGADLDRFQPDGESLFQYDGFTFLSVFDFIHRKGWDVLMEAFSQEFTKYEDVNLLVHTHYSQNTEKDKRMVEAELREIAEKYNSPDYNLSFGYIEEEEFPKLYRSGDAFVLPTRGEGFGLPLFEAAASGLPVVTTDYGAPPEYLGDEPYWIETKGVEPYPFEEAVKHEPNCTGLEFARPSIISARRKMRDVYLDWKDDDVKSPDVSHVNWDDAAEQVAERLEEIYSNHY